MMRCATSAGPTRVLAGGSAAATRADAAEAGLRSLRRTSGLRSQCARCSRRASALAGVEGLEPPTPGFGDRCSNQLSYTPPRALLTPRLPCEVKAAVVEDPPHDDVSVFDLGRRGGARSQSRFAPVPGASSN